MLDNFTSKNGAIDIKNKSTGKYNTLYPKAKDIIVWDGETLHKSGPNRSNKPRRTWLQIYSTTDITKVKTKSKKFSTFYSQRFIKGNIILILLKLKVLKLIMVLKFCDWFKVTYV